MNMSIKIYNWLWIHDIRLSYMREKEKFEGNFPGQVMLFITLPIYLFIYLIYFVLNI